MSCRHLLNEEERQKYMAITEENLEFLRKRYNRVNRWVIADMIRRSAYRYPDKPALIFGDNILTYALLESECNKVANALIDLGIKKYDRVAILAHNTIHHVLTWLGTAKAGGIYLAINYLLRGKDISFCINHSESKVFIIEDALYDTVKEVLDDMPGVKTFIWSDQGRGDRAPENFLEFNDWYKDYPSVEPDVYLRIEDPVQMTYTSGTETLPKGVILTNQALVSEYVGAIIDGEYVSDDVNINAMPIFHCAQRDVFLNPIFMVGGTNILLPQPVPADIMASIEKYRATMFFAAPTVWIALLRHPDFHRFDLTSLNKGYYGASIMPVEVLKELQKRLPSCRRFYNYYGQTELSPYHTILKPAFQFTKPGSAGQGGLNMETRIEDENHNPISAPGEPGEICGRGPHVMLMYFKEPEKTEDALAHDWFHSGDIGVLDEDDFVTVVDRKKDMVKTGGENVSSREVEEVVYRHPAVSEVAVIGLPHEKWVEAVTAVVVLKSGHKATEEEIITLCREHLAPFKVPKRIVFTEKLPKTPSGKILKRDLRNLFSNIYNY
ncbi:AMP-binding protein [Desulfofundulus thermobenzoicus]|uniref:AMP-binding protein n=1 Tax=Desulfofundulus thermobenzoicus TaxID=29376 RepID=A0A6N7IM82_9FIRM|nr:acyl-CoA synthetase [Desulfofundulus thermobenzoicus]MQL51086.1 AMP-binding protein [Desulfofundulus thermobenzoicus]